MSERYTAHHASPKRRLGWIVFDKESGRIVADSMSRSDAELIAWLLNAWLGYERKEGKS